MENYSGLKVREERKSGNFFPGETAHPERRLPGRCSKSGHIFLWWAGPFFLPQKNQKNQKSPSARGGATEK
jgi:hypothetical protein